MYTTRAGLIIRNGFLSAELARLEARAVIIAKAVLLGSIARSGQYVVEGVQVGEAAVLHAHTIRYGALRDAIFIHARVRGLRLDH